MVDDDELVPKRSARLAVKSKYREMRPEAQARKVTIKRLGFEMETQLPDEASFQEFKEAFTLPLTPSKREAMQVLFPGRKQRASPAVRAALVTATGCSICCPMLGPNIFIWNVLGLHMRARRAVVCEFLL